MQQVVSRPHGGEIPVECYLCSVSVLFRPPVPSCSPQVAFSGLTHTLKVQSFNEVYKYNTARLRLGDLGPPTPLRPTEDWVSALLLTIRQASEAAGQ